MTLLWNSAWTLLVLANLFWSGNVIIGRSIVGQVPPIALAYWRWTGACVIACCIAWPHLRRDWPELLRHWKLMLLLSATGIASFNTMSYIGLTSTTALNALLLQSSLPLIIVALAYLLFGDRPTLRQSAGILVSMLGVATIVGQGSFETLLHLSLNIGDVWILAALLVYGVYCAMLRRRPSVHPLSFLVVAMGLGSCMILPFMLWEAAQGATIVSGLPSVLAIAYTAVFPSFLAYLCFNRGIEILGAAPAGQSVHLMPVFGSILAVVFLGEAFRAYHASGILLIGIGIVLASLPTRRLVPSAPGEPRRP